jgi:ABC-type multidrug transport system ATPase subunit
MHCQWLNARTGVLPPSGGDALVYGESLSTPGGIDRIRSIMGVCPQFDVLWQELTGFEHLYIYGRVKVGKGCPSGAGGGMGTTNLNTINTQQC